MSENPVLTCSYVHLKEAWYCNTVLPAYKGMVDEIQLSIQDESKEESLLGEMSFRLMQINEVEQAWEFRMFDDSFNAFYAMAEELSQVIGHTNERTTAEEIMEMLDIIGFKDYTQRAQKVQ